VRRAARRRALAVAGLLVLGMAGVVLYAVWPRGVHVAAPAHHGACEAVMPLMPSSVGGRAASDRFVATAGDRRDIRVWGEPAIIATCGWPALGPTADECLEVDGVDWVVQRLSDGARFTTYGRDPAVEVLVPHAYAPEPLLLPAFGDAARALPANGRRCR
jgi:hypothetical protein